MILSPFFTLYIKIPHHDDEPGTRDWIARNELVCVSSPRLTSITGESAAIIIKDLSEKNLSISLRGKSGVEVETLQPDFDSVSVHLRDSSELKFEMAEEIPSNGVLQVNWLKADLQGFSFLDAGHMRVSQMEKSITENSAIGLSGATLEMLKKRETAAVR